MSVTVVDGVGKDDKGIVNSGLMDGGVVDSLKAGEGVVTPLYDGGVQVETLISVDNDVAKPSVVGVMVRRKMLRCASHLPSDPPIDLINALLI